ncbi:unnamed protein product [Toxocara canis]|uniref:C-type lectin domain-containing protein n=1 Tax=Toxocara canis TaxID=6265 RepID=A0A183ULR8_TOXCA|nr:unnamed protein product [Toxocara canis]
MGIRETVRVFSLHECQARCRGCSSIILYPDLICVILEHSAPVVMSSFGAVCCYPHGLVGHTNILGVWTLFNLTNSTYKVLPYDCQATPETYERDCEEEGAHLASIESAEEDQFVASLGTTSCNCKHIGLYSASSPQSSFQWRDGSEVKYTNWRAGEPFERGFVCAHIWQTSGWASSPCTARGIDSVGCCAVCKRNS